MREFFASNRLSAYIDGELSSPEMAEMDRALRENPQLRQEYERLLATVEFVRSVGPVEAPPDFHSAVLARTASEAVPGGWWRRVHGFFSGIPMETVAVAMAAVLVTIVIGQRMDHPVLVPESSVEPSATEDPAIGGTEKMDTATKEMANLVDRSLESKGSEDQAPQPEPPVATLGTRGGEGVNTNIDPKEVGEALRSTTDGLEDDGVAALTDQASGPAVDPQAYTDGNIDQLLAAAMAYRLHVADPKALRSLASLTARHGGMAFVDGQPIDPGFDFEEGADRVQVTVRLPAASLTAFYKDLASVGEVESISGDRSTLYGGGDILIAVDVMYAPEVSQ